MDNLIKIGKGNEYAWLKEGIEKAKCYIKNLNTRNHQDRANQNYKELSYHLRLGGFHQ